MRGSAGVVKRVRLRTVWLSAYVGSTPTPRISSSKILNILVMPENSEEFSNTGNFSEFPCAEKILFFKLRFIWMGGLEI